jgi:hypothetical protein
MGASTKRRRLGPRFGTSNGSGSSSRSLVSAPSAASREAGGTERMWSRWHQRRGAGYAQRSSGNPANVAELWCIGIGGIAVMLVMDMLVARAL